MARRSRTAHRRRLTRIVRAGESDLAGILAIDVTLVRRARQDEIVRESIAAGTCFVALVESAAAGFVTWDLGFFHRPFVRLLAIDATYRRAGIASMLLERVETDVRAGGSSELFVSTEAINAAMQTLLLRGGYAASGAIENINEPGNAELVYYKRL